MVDVHLRAGAVAHGKGGFGAGRMFHRERTLPAGRTNLDLQQDAVGVRRPDTPTHGQTLRHRPDGVRRTRSRGCRPVSPACLRSALPGFHVVHCGRACITAWPMPVTHGAKPEGRPAVRRRHRAGCRAVRECLEHMSGNAGFMSFPAMFTVPACCCRARVRLSASPLRCRLPARSAAGSRYLRHERRHCRRRPFRRATPDLAGGTENDGTGLSR